MKVYVTILLVLVVVLACLGFLYMNQKTYEGFDGNVPESNETSAIARDTASATTTNPKLALAQPKDIQALMETVKNFQLLYNAQDPMTLNLDEQSLQQTQYLSMQAENLTNQLQAALANSDAVSMTVDDTSQLRNAYDCSINILRGKSEVLGGFNDLTSHNPPPKMGTKLAAKKPVTSRITSQGSTSNELTIDTLINLQLRVQSESLRLSNLRSSAPTMVKRIEDLNNLSADLGDIISSVRRGKTKLSDVNITPDYAERFLKTLGKNQPAEMLNLKVKKAQKPIAQLGGAPGLPSTAALQPLLEATRNMKWSMAIGFESDPAVKQTQEVLDKINTIESNINKYMISDTPMPPKIQDLYTQELNILKNLTNKSKSNTSSIMLGPPKPILKDRESSSHVFTPSPENLNVAQGMNMEMPAGSASNGIGSGDYALSDENIQHRASAASFDDSMVGGLDYKTRALEMCRQIQAANLGDPANFGCIKNPNEVSASYSWKGNYQMVCSRLGDTWGNWYPQMFGCPKVDPTAKFMRQA
jgi:hypothetical protein